MNKKLNNFLKKPLLIISAVLAAVGLVVVITLNCISVCAGTYKGTSTTTLPIVGEVTATTSYKFKGDKVVATQTINDKTTSREASYKVKDGELYVDEIKVAKINAFKIVPLAQSDVKLVNKGAVAFNVIGIVVLVLGVLGVAGSVTYTLLDGKKKKSK